MASDVKKLRSISAFPDSLTKETFFVDPGVWSLYYFEKPLWGQAPERRWGSPGTQLLQVVA